MDENVDGTMEQASGVDLAARCPPDDAVLGVDDVEKFVGSGG